MGLLDFFSLDQRRKNTAAMSELADNVEYFIPPELRGLLRFGADMTPSASLQRAGDATGRAFAPNRTASQRIGDVGAALSETAGIAAPMAVAGKAGMPVAQAVQEGLLGFSAGAQKAGSTVADRMNQRGPMPTLYSNPIMTAPETTAKTPAQEVADLLSTGRASEVTDDMLARFTPNDEIELFGLYQGGKTGADMPMDEASRMARAQEMGFGGDMYHGSNSSFASFDPDMADATGQKVMAHGGGTYLAESPRMASRYATRRDGGSMYPVRENMERPWTGEMSVSDLNPNDLAKYMAAESGPEALGFFGRRNSLGMSVVPDPTNIRSRFARFDPRLSHLKNLSAGLGGLGLLGVMQNQGEGQ